MAKAIFGVSGLRSFPDNSTQYQCPVGGLVSDADIVGDEDAHSVTFRVPATLRNFQIYVSNDANAGQCAVRVRKNLATPSGTLEILLDGDSAPGLYEDAVNEVSFAVGDTMSIQVFCPTEAGTNLLDVTMMRFEAETDGDTTLVVMGSSGGDINRAGASTTYYFSMNGDSNQSVTTVSQAQMRVPGAYTSQGLRVAVRTNARTTNSTVRSDVNGSAGNQTVTIVAGSSATVTDTSNSDTLSDGSLICFALVNGTGSEELRINAVTSNMTHANRRWLMSVAEEVGTILPAGATRYSACAGDAILSTFTTEPPVQATAPFDCTASHVAAHVMTNAGSGGTSIVYLRDNGADSALSASHGAGVTDWQTATTDVAITADTDEINFKFISSHSSGDVTFTAAVVEFYTTGAAPPAVVPVPVGKRARAWHTR